MPFFRPLKQQRSQISRDEISNPLLTSSTDDELSDPQVRSSVTATEIVNLYTNDIPSNPWCPDKHPKKLPPLPEFCEVAASSQRTQSPDFVVITAKDTATTRLDTKRHLPRTLRPVFLNVDKIAPGEPARPTPGASGLALARGLSLHYITSLASTQVLKTTTRADSTGQGHYLHLGTLRLDMKNLNPRKAAAAELRVEARRQKAEVKKAKELTGDARVTEAREVKGKAIASVVAAKPQKRDDGRRTRERVRLAVKQARERPIEDEREKRAAKKARRVGGPVARTGFGMSRGFTCNRKLSDEGIEVGR